MIRVHLATFNHFAFAIVDQIRFLKLVFRFLEIPFTWGPGFSSGALNLFIECTTAADNRLVLEFTQRTGKRLAFIFTEHVQVDGDVVYFNTIPSNQIVDDDYMGQGTAFSRLYNFMELLDCSRKLYTLGDYPSVEFLKDFRISKDFLEFPFPPVRPPALSPAAPIRQRGFDFVFTGSRTGYREEVLGKLEREFRVCSLRMSANEGQRGRLYRNAAFILNIPQSPQWSWSSPMRILAALCYGRTIVSLQTSQGSFIDAFANPVGGDDLLPAMRRLLEAGAEESEDRIISSYNAVASVAERWAPLRKDLADWAVEEGLV